VPASGCVHTNNTASCDDDDECTTGDICADGTCAGPDAVTCNDNNGCTTDTCESATGCVYANNTDACDDSNVCTVTDVCAAGTCVGSGAKDCDDDNTCSVDTCDSVSGCANTMVSNCCGNGTVDSGEECDDGNQVDGDECSDYCKSNDCGGYEADDACWYVGGQAQSCDTVCEDHCGFDAEGSQHTGNDIGLYFYPERIGQNNYLALECVYSAAPWVFGANGSLPTGSQKSGACSFVCACNC